MTEFGLFVTASLIAKLITYFFKKIYEFINKQLETDWIINLKDVTSTSNNWLFYMNAYETTKYIFLKCYMKYILPKQK